MEYFFSQISPECYIFMAAFSVVITGLNYLFWWKWTAERIEKVQCPIPQATERLANHGCHSCARYFDECICPPENDFHIEIDKSLD